MSQEKFLHKTQIALQNAVAIPEVSKGLNQYAYTAKKMQEGVTLHESVLHLIGQQQLAMAHESQTRRTLREAKGAVEVIYKKHLRTARFIYKQDAEVTRKMQLKGRRRQSMPAWFGQLNSFYAYLDTEMAAKYNVDLEEVEQVKGMIANINTLELLVYKASAQSQQATVFKNVEYKKLKAWMRKFWRAALVAFEDNPQQLEALGMVVRAVK